MIDEEENQDALDAQADALLAEQEVREMTDDDRFGVGGVEPDPEDMLYE
jgi:hypothetical protein